MLNSTLVAPDVFNYTSVPYNITWYDKKGEELSDQPGRILLRGETLWFLNVTLDDDGEYTMVLRYGQTDMASLFGMLNRNCTLMCHLFQITSGAGHCGFILAFGT